MKNRFFFYVLLFLLGGSMVSSQTGFLSGTINDSEFNDVLPFANVLAKGTTVGTTSDFEGKYTVELNQGSYTIVFSYLGYQTKEVAGVIIKPGEEIPLNTNLILTL